MFFFFTKQRNGNHGLPDIIPLLNDNKKIFIKSTSKQGEGIANTNNVTICKKNDS